MYPEAKFYEPYGRTLTVSGTPMVRGFDPQDAARRFLSDHADVFESEFADLVPDREVKLLNNRTVIFYHQEIDGFSVDGSSGRTCYADIDSSTGLGVLDIFDYLVFQSLFLENASLACDCDTSTGTGICDILDFVCFQTAFARGCEKE